MAQKTFQPNESDIYKLNGKEVLVSRDPVYTHKTIYQGRYIGPQPHSYLPLSILVTILCPPLGIVAVIFAVLSIKSYGRGDVTHANEWADRALLTSMITIAAAVIIYIAIGFSISNLPIKGGHSY